jgi:hypothetical protein
MSEIAAAGSPTTVQVVATVLFALAVLHTFSTRWFEHLAHLYPRHAGVFHMLGEVEVVFGVWALLLIVFLALGQSPDSAMAYLESKHFTEPALIFVVMVIAASRPILDVAAAVLSFAGRLLPLPRATGYYFAVLFVGPLLGSFITEPAAMTLAAMLLRERYFSTQAPANFKYATLGVLFVNVSIGGTLTPYAAPPVLMVAERWGWDVAFMLQTFGWKAAFAACVNAALVTVSFRNYLGQLPTTPQGIARLDVPWPLAAVHVGFLAAVVVSSHRPIVFLALFLFFLGFTEAYRRYQKPLILREALLVGFFLAGLVVLGGKQDWWLQPLLADIGASPLYYGATLLTAVTDNAALTYLGTLVEGMTDEAKYALVSGAVTGGGLTVIANAPNPAGFAILKGSFAEGSISPLWLAVAASPPTLMAIVAFRFLPG